MLFGWTYYQTSICQHASLHRSDQRIAETCTHNNGDERLHDQIWPECTQACDSDTCFGRSKGSSDSGQSHLSISSARLRTFRAGPDTKDVRRK